MDALAAHEPSHKGHHPQSFWLWVMCLTGVDYFNESENYKNRAGARARLFKSEFKKRLKNWVVEDYPGMTRFFMKRKTARE